jgi:transposase
MSKYFRPWNIDQTLLLPPNVQDFVPKGHVSRFIVELVRESLDLKEITGSYVSSLGQPPFDPRMMVALLLHGYASGLYSSRRIAKACRERNDFVMIVALDAPDFRTISDFRKRHLKALGALFVQVLKLCETAGLVKLGHVALDGTKIKANASKHKAMSYERMKKREAELQAEVARMLVAAEAADCDEDETFGKDKRGDEMPDWASGGGRAPHRGPKGTAAPGRRPQEAGQTGGAAIGPTRSQVATQLHRSGQPHHEVEGWLRAGL